MSLLRELVAATRLLPGALVAGVRNLALAPHRPVDVGDGQVWCLRDRVPWPCDAVVRLTEPPAGQEAP